MSDPPEITYRVGTKPISAVMESVNEDEARRGDGVGCALALVWLRFLFRVGFLALAFLIAFVLVSLGKVI